METVSEDFVCNVDCVMYIRLDECRFQLNFVIFCSMLLPLSKINMSVSYAC